MRITCINRYPLLATSDVSRWCYNFVGFSGDTIHATRPGQRPGWIGAHKEALALVLAVGTAAAGGAWTLFTYFDGDSGKSGAGFHVDMDIRGGRDVNISGSTITFNYGISIEEHEKRLVAREAQITEKLRNASAQERTVLEAELKATRDRLLNIARD